MQSKHLTVLRARVREGEKVDEAWTLYGGEDADFNVHLGAAPWFCREHTGREEKATQVLGRACGGIVGWERKGKIRTNHFSM
jgi:hypothetical protein